ncbi:MAG: hypothetical protein J5546_11545 [Lachnospiraceae bacterium]|nr:hypothetical protein [Lachnospiraceae bacterium]
MKKTAKRKTTARFLSILLALVLVLTNFGGAYPGKVKAEALQGLARTVRFALI